MDHVITRFKAKLIKCSNLYEAFDNHSVYNLTIKFGVMVEKF